MAQVKEKVQEAIKVQVVKEVYRPKMLLPKIYKPLAYPLNAGSQQAASEIVEEILSSSESCIMRNLLEKQMPHYTCKNAVLTCDQLIN